MAYQLDWCMSDCVACMLCQVDPSVGFDQVGGLDHYIAALKEMVFLPLVYPELFERSTSPRPEASSSMAPQASP